MILQEVKMTFDETMACWFPNGFEDWDGNLDEGDLKGMGNAAIASVLEEVEDEQYWWNDTCHSDRILPSDVLKKLLTAS
jgi:hypothetical protein